MDDSTAPAAVTTGPATFAEAFAGDASSASTPAPETTSDQSAATTVPPESQPTGDGSTQQVGEPPKERWADILANARTKATEEYRQKYGWAEQVDQQAVATAQQIGQLYQQDRAGFIRQILAEAMTDPELAPAIRSEVARALGTRPQAAGPDLSQVVIDLGNGQTVPLADLKAQWQQELRQEFAPVAKTAEEFRALQQQTIKQAEANQFASAFLGDLTKLPGFEQHKATIAQQLSQVQLPSDHPAEVRAATLQIYLQTVLPTLTSQAQSQLLDTLQQKAAASTSVNPGSAASATAAKVTSFHDPALKW